MTPTPISAIADRMFTAIEHGDIEALGAMWADDIAVWRLGGGRERDKARALAVLEWFIAVTSERSYGVLDRRIFDGGFVQQHLLHARGKSGAELTLRACLVVLVDEHGLITRIDEYLNPADLTPPAQERHTPEN